MRYAIAGLVVLLSACVTEPERQVREVDQPAVSEARTASPAAALQASLHRVSPSLQALLVEGEFVYVALEEGLVPTGQTASIRNQRLDGTVTVTVRNGGFDPVPIAALAGDSIIVNVQLAEGGFTSFRSVVPIKRRPSVVRTSPVRSKTSVPLNMNIRVVFSEPIDPATVNASTIRLTRGGRSIPGIVRLIDGSGLIAAFIPTEALAPRAVHRLEIDSDIRDEQGDELGRVETVTFETGTTFVGPPVGIHITPDTVEMTTLNYQMSATVVDEFGTELGDLPLVWYGGEPGVAVSETGLVTALAEGSWSVGAKLRDDEAVRASVTIKVRSTDPAGSLVVTPSPAVVALDDTLLLSAAVRDVSGRVLGRSVAWSSSDPSVATVDVGTYGLQKAAVITRRTGTVTITATSGMLSSQATVDVTPARMVSSIVLSPDALTVPASASAHVTATLRDAGGRTIFVRQLTWTSDDPTIASVDANGLVRGHRSGTTSITAAVEGASARISVTVTTLAYASVAAGRWHTCALTPEGAAWCWGTLVDNTSAPSRSVVPVAVPGSLTFASLSGGLGHTCGLTRAGKAYCWGSNASGTLGNGSTVSSATPVAVQGDHVFTTLVAANDHSCGLTADGAAWCWGGNFSGQLGNGTSGNSSVPVRAASDLTFTALVAAFSRTCGLAASGVAWCWGINDAGQLGIGRTTSGSLTPVAVFGGLTFSSLGSGAALTHNCAVAAGGAAWCWGGNPWGQLGNSIGVGTIPAATTPMPVTGGLEFASVVTGASHSCGLTPSGAAYCWGDNKAGQLGTGRGGSATPPNPFDFHAAPVPVSGGITFAMLTAGQAHTCGMSVSGILYCWGAGFDGQLGIGSLGVSNVPIKVGGQP